MHTMIFVSYAPNAEDVPLWRALRDVRDGRYLDWSSEPAAGPSATRALYDRGWRGVSVRPADQRGGLAAARPLDVVVTPEDAPGLPTHPPLHLLRVAAAGSEAAVLRALDLSRRQPWVLVVAGDEAAAVATEAGYQPALFDGISRFYVSPQHGELVDRLTAPANATDNYVRASDSALAERLAATELALEAAQARVGGSSQRLVDALQVAGVARDDIGRMAEEFTWLRGLIADERAGEGKSRAEVAWLAEQLSTSRQQLLARAEESAWLRGCVADAEVRVANEARLRADAEARAHGGAAELAGLRASTSWRITAPLRRIKGGARSPAPQPTPALAPPAPPPPDPAPVSRAETPALTEPAPRPGPVSAPLPDPPAVPRFIPAPAPAEPRGTVTAVHQFHAGSARGDAITNAMLLIRSQLRAAGFRSDIFVETRGPGLDDGIKLLDEMPEHDRYVLMFHHSMGFPSFDAIAALPARKVLVYHNITPPEMLAGIPRIQRLAQTGREQLATLCGQVTAALADSDYNALELRRLGFLAIRTCPLLFDVSELMRAAAGPRAGDGVFTVLFVGRVTQSKSQDALVDAFAAFRRRFGRPCRLVLVGALDADEHGYLAAIRQRIASAGLDGDVHLTGLVSDRELRDWYRQADLYVSLSRHEGFGVPLIEALAHGVPVLAWPAGAVPFTLAGAGTLLRSRAPKDVAAAMLAVAVADHRRDLATAGLRSLAGWSLSEHMPVLLETLAIAGAAPPRDRGSRQRLAANLQVTVCGHVGKTYSLAVVNRALARTVEALRPGTVRLFPVEGVPTREFGEVPAPERCFVTTLAARATPDTGPELVLSGHYPLYVPTERGDLLAALFFWEESLVPAATVATLNTAFDAVFAPSRSVAKALVDSGVAIPVLNLGQAPDLARFAALDAARTRPGPFTFLHVSSAFPRKGVDVLLAAWRTAFTRRDAVRLVIKAFPNPHNDAAEQVARLREDYPDAAPIELVDEDLPPDAMQALYRDAGVVVLPTRGEGYNLPAAEAMAAGVPVIVTGHGGHMDFCTPDTARLLHHHLAPARSHLAAAQSLWAEPDVSDLAAALGEAASGALDRLAEPARRAIAVHADPAAFTDRLAQASAGLMLAPPAPPLRLTWISSWGVRCGVAGYSAALVEALQRDGLEAPTILADDRTAPEGRVRAAWALGGEGGVDRLLAAVAKADGDVTVVQHQPGLLTWPALARLLDGLAAAGRPAVVTLHNTVHLLEVPAAERNAATRALGRTARVLVHTLADIERLGALGLAAVTTLFPHPVPTPLTAPVRPLSPDAAPVIGCTGFFLPDKGIGTLIAATSRLRQRWPGIRLRLVNAEYDDPASAAEIAACRAIARTEGLAVEWHTSFVPIARQKELLRGCDLVVLPYQRSKEASSAALRSALATGIPLAVTPLPLFDEAADAVFRLPGTGTAEMALGMASLLGNTERRAALALSARSWMADRALPDIARRLHGTLRGLAVQARIGQPLDGAPWQPGGPA